MGLTKASDPFSTLTHDDVCTLLNDCQPPREVCFLIIQRHGLPVRASIAWMNFIPLIDPFSEGSDEERRHILLERERLAQERRMRLVDKMLALLQELKAESVPEPIRTWSIDAERQVREGILPLRSSY